MEELVCSKCGGKVYSYMLTSYPPQIKYECSNCGAVKIIKMTRQSNKEVIHFNDEQNK